jgi:hypothetical protein
VSLLASGEGESVVIFTGLNIRSSGNGELGMSFLKTECRRVPAFFSVVVLGTTPFPMTDEGLLRPPDTELCYLPLSRESQSTFNEVFVSRQLSLGWHDNGVPFPEQSVTVTKSQGDSPLGDCTCRTGEKHRSVNSGLASSCGVGNFVADLVSVEFDVTLFFSMDR